MARVQIDITAQDQASSVFERMSGSLMEFKAGLDLAIGAAGQFVEAAKKIYAVGRAGAELEYAQKKFDRLTASIGTTTEALMVDLREATRGTMSDAELMASAGDMMSLGLAKTHDQTVRLAKVTAGLGMDMNQLVLTLANQTTMRFDQLGVSIDGFDARLQKLKASGMDANAAFTEAFLQQAEIQLDKVGNSADESIGKFRRFEAATKNLADQMKKNATPAVAAFAGAMASLLEQGAQNAAFDEATRGMNQIEKAAFMAQGALLGLSDQEKATRDAFQKNRAAAEEMAAGLKNGLIPAVTNASVASEGMELRFSAAGQAARSAAWSAADMAASAQQLAAAEQNLKVAQEQLATAQERWKSGAGGSMASMLEQQGLKGQDLYQALEILDQMMGTNEATAVRQRDAMQALVKTYDPAKPEAFRAALGALMDQFMPLDTSIASSTQKMMELNDQISNFEGVHTAIVRVVVDNAALANAYNNAGVGSGGESIAPPSVSEDGGGGVGMQSIGLGGGRSATYNLTVITTQSPDVVQHGFAVLRAWGSV